MTFIVTAKWTAKVGSEQAVAAAIQKLIEPSRAEPGCLQYRAHQSVVDGRIFLLYEEYVDEAAYDAHAESDHFRRHAIGEGIPLLESRAREFYVPLEAEPPTDSSVFRVGPAKPSRSTEPRA